MDSLTTPPTEKTYIELLFVDENKSTNIQIGQNVRGISYKGKRPTAFLVHHSTPIVITPELRKWFFTEFIHIFDKSIFETYLALPLNQKLISQF